MPSATRGLVTVMPARWLHLASSHVIRVVHAWRANFPHEALR